MTQLPDVLTLFEKLQVVLVLGFLDEPHAAR